MQALKDTAAIVSGGKQLSFFNKAKVQTIHIDPEIVMQVYENILSNAVRYAKKSITVTCNVEKDMFSICVMDSV